MPPKGQLTRENIIAKAAPIFNTKGFAAASMTDVMHATGLQKGGLYNHFETKDELLLAAFDYALQQVTDAVLGVIKREQTSTQKLTALINFLVIRTNRKNPESPYVLRLTLVSLSCVALF